MKHLKRLPRRDLLRRLTLFGSTLITAFVVMNPVIASPDIFHNLYHDKLTQRTDEKTAADALKHKQEKPRINATSKVVKASDVQWGYLNPLRGDKSPGAADLWGDRTQNTATGMLVRFKEGFASPPHIHNITYRGVVIQGKVHNAEPKSARFWLPAGSYWTQPAGQNHITAALSKGTQSAVSDEDENGALIYLEIDEGPYLVKPSQQRFDNGESPVNVHADNIVWLNENRVKNLAGKGVEISYLWETHFSQSLLLKLPAGFSGKLFTSADEFRAVVIQGDVNYFSTAADSQKMLQPGSYFDSRGKFEHQLSSQQASVIYLKINGEFTVRAKTE